MAGFFKGLVQGFAKWQLSAISRVLGVVTPALGAKVQDFGGSIGTGDIFGQYTDLLDTAATQIVGEAQTNTRMENFYNWIERNRLLFWIIVVTGIYLVYHILKKRRR